MSATSAEFDGIDCAVSRSGYTGEDGFEISVPAKNAEKVARALLAEPEVKPVGLGARDSLRLEAGLPLYGHDLDETTSPVEADLTFAIPKARRASGGFPGAKRILRELAEGPSRKRVGIRPSGRAPVREGAEIIGPDGTAIGVVTSGGFGGSVNAPVAMGYVETQLATPGTESPSAAAAATSRPRSPPCPSSPTAMSDRGAEENEPRATRKTMNGCSSTAIPPRSASPPTPPSS